MAFRDAPGRGRGPAAADPDTPEARRERERGLVDRARGGDAAAFEQLYRDNVGRVFALCYRLAGDATLAEELTQDAFVRAWERLDGFRGDSLFSTWMHPLAANLAMSERRSRRRRLARVFATDELPEPRDVPRHDGAAAMDLEKAVGTLPPGAREVFVLHDVEGYRHEEIARMTGVATGTSKAQLHRARHLLRDALTRVRRLGGRAR